MKAPEPRRADAVRVRGHQWLMLAVVALAGLLAFTWPLLVPPSAHLDQAQLGPLLFALVLPALLAVVLSELTSNDLDVKALAMLGVLTAVGAVLRPLGAGTGGLEAVYLPIILAGRVFGPGFGFVLGSTTLFTSALLTGGVGPWLPYQMIAAGFVGLGAGLLPRLRGAAEVALLAAYGFVAGFGYGWVMDFAFWPFNLGNGTQLSFDPAAGPLRNLHVFALYKLATAMAWDAGRAISNAVLIGALGAPLLRVLRRAARTAHFVEAGESRVTGVTSKH
ncbi:ECF transporter S component [Luteococcus peritonei]|uniref:ECF transporter S component n=1 Tax=Luteococcus peritonei TaxID=88874 RepID=A0ABW4RRQ3_9ACTN